MVYIPEKLRALVHRRVNHACEYCLLPDTLSFYPHEVDHVIAIKHGGTTTADNLAYACWRCNRYKGSDLGSFEPESRHFSFLFNPRQQNWDDHFYLQNAQITGKTSEGKTTVHFLRFNSPERIAERKRMNP